MIQYPLKATQQAVFDLRRFFVVLALTGVALLLPFPEGLSPEGQRAVALFVFTGSILALEPAPLPISALLVPVAQVALGIDTASGAFGAFAQPSLFLVLSSLFLAEALRKHGLTRRLAIYAIVASGGSLPRLLFNLMAMTTLLSMWVLNTATTAVLIPVALTIAPACHPAGAGAPVVATLVLGIAYAASLGGMATIVGSGENAIAAG
jgi:sodium-dependent dicarboxylate transporter 2/3/5